MHQYNQLLIVAGTHGNELTGIYIEKQIRNKQLNLKRSSFEVQTLLGNPAAIANNQRYIDTDLNRLFTKEAQQKTAANNEQQIAQRLQQQYQGQPKLFVIDLHNTTSRMGATLILLARTPFYEQMGAYVKQQMPQANILFESEKSFCEQPYLCTMTGSGVMIEVEEQSHGVLTQQSLILMQEMLVHVVDFIDLYKQQQVLELASYEAYELTEELAYPLDKDGMRLATVHPNICGQDFKEVKSGEPLLLTFAGEEISWQGTQSTYPHFINEAAYSQKHIALALANKVVIAKQSN